MFKYTFMFALILLINSTYAKETCESSILEIAQTNMDQKAKTLDFFSSDVNETTLKLISRSQKTGNIKFEIKAMIEKATYKLNIEVDSSCGIESLKIKEIL